MLPLYMVKEGDQQEIIPMGIPTLLAREQSSCSSGVVQMGRCLLTPSSLPLEGSLVVASIPRGS